jgi:hypothetical protein
MASLGGDHPLSNEPRTRSLTIQRQVPPEGWAVGLRTVVSLGILMTIPQQMAYLLIWAGRGEKLVRKSLGTRTQRD